MITGIVTANREATIQLVLTGPNHRPEVVEAILDTGFNGFLTLPSHVVRTLALPFAGNRRAMLADGRSVVLDLYLATIVWGGEEREVLVLQAEGGSLIGMSLLYGHRVTLNVVDNGSVIIDTLP
ncbi:MAG TPA: clan AA aspartic protease [Alphaproteobacteria bacterium]|nr:clan AA aspartic protease [Alphaproteobacteria bacterium]